MEFKGIENYAFTSLAGFRRPCSYCSYACCILQMLVAVNRSPGPLLLWIIFIVIAVVLPAIFGMNCKKLG
jgi:hypothetical protein